MYIKRQPLVSVIISTHNRKKELELAIKSIKRQTYKKVEIIVISGSTDGSNEMVKKKFPEVELITVPSSYWLCEKMNIGFSNAKGKIAIELDDDAEMANRSYIKTAVEEFENKDNSICGIFGSVFNPRTKENEYYDDGEEYYAGTFNGTSVAFDRDRVLEVGGYTPQYQIYMNEPDLSSKLLSKGYKLKYTPKMKIRHNRLSDLSYERSIKKRFFYWRNNLFHIWSYYPFHVALGSTLLFISYNFFQSLYYKCPHRFFQAIWSFLRNINVVIDNRRKVDSEVQLPPLAGFMLFLRKRIPHNKFFSNLFCIRLKLMDGKLAYKKNYRTPYFIPTK